MTTRAAAVLLRVGYRREIESFRSSPASSWTQRKMLTCPWQQKTMEPSSNWKLESRDWLGRGGLMGLPWTAFPSHLAGVAMRIRVYALSALWLVIATQYFAWQLPLVALLAVPDGGRLYKRASTWFDAVAQPAILALPYSWCGLRVHTSQFALMTKMAANGNALVMTNHCSRVDWIVGMLLGSVLEPRTRIGFVAEITMMLMPVFGWSRLLFGDIFLRRTFHRDGKRIAANLQSFHEAGVRRMIFVAPEGAIVDPGVAKDAAYVSLCKAFMSDRGRPELKFLLTPRYKGIQLLACHAPTSTYSVTMAFRCHSTEVPDAAVGIDPTTGAAIGGELCTQPLDHPRRVVPDLHTIFRGGLHVFCHIHTLHLPADADGVRDALIADYERKDSLLAAFEAHGKFDTTPNYAMATLPIDHVRMNLTLLAHTALSVRVAQTVLGVEAAAVASAACMAWFIVAVLHALTHLYAEQISGASRESLVFETVLKTGLDWWSGSLDQGVTTPAKVL